MREKQRIYGWTLHRAGPCQGMRATVKHFYSVHSTKKINSGDSWIKHAVFKIHMIRKS